MNRLLRTLLLLSLVLAFSTSGRAGEDKPSSTPYFPLVVGNTWEYRVGENRFALKVTKMEKVKDAKSKETNTARLELYVNGKSVSYENVGVTPTAVVRYTFEGKAATPPIPFLKLPPTKGETWNVESKVDGQVLKGAFTITEDKETVKVPAGAYTALTVRSKGLEVNGVKLDLTYHFADKVGMVKQVIDFAGQKAVIELEKFTPGKQ
jgi:hypothetical protein